MWVEKGGVKSNFYLGSSMRWSLTFHDQPEVLLRSIYRGFGYTRKQPQESNVRVHVRVDAELLQTSWTEYCVPVH